MQLAVSILGMLLVISAATLMNLDGETRPARAESVLT
jgi:hypothetical protein